MAIRGGIFARDQIQPLGVFVIYFGLPALIFNSMVKHAEVGPFDLDLLTAYSLGSLAVAMGVIVAIRFVRGKSLQQAAVRAMGVSLSNSAFIGYPIAQQLIGDRAGIMLAMYVLVENMIILPLMLVLADGGSKGAVSVTQPIREIFARIWKNPLIVAIFVGLIFSATGLGPGVAIGSTINMLSSASAPIALFYIGGMLASANFKGMAFDVGFVAIGKLVAHPLAVMSMFMLYPCNDPALKMAAILNAGMPMATIYPLLAQKYRQESFCSVALVVTTAASFITINILLWVMKQT